jgi:hypothetical protein
LAMFNNLYSFADEPLPFFWNDRIYASLDKWRAETGLDENSSIAPFPPRRAAIMRAAFEALMREQTLRPDMFHELYRLANERD